MANKNVNLKCGHSINTKDFEPTNTGNGWVLQGYEPECNRTVNVSIANKRPTLPTMERWMDRGIAKSLDGCEVEPDGRCDHNMPSWLTVLGFI